MRKLAYSLLLIFSINSHALAEGTAIEKVAMAPLTVDRIFRKDFIIDETKLPDLIDKGETVSACVSKYLETESKTYAKKVQSNLYDLMNNFDSIVSKIHGKKAKAPDVPYEEKLEALAKVQCEAYYAIGVLK